MQNDSRDAIELSLDNKLAGILAPVSALRGQFDLGVGDTAALIECIEWAAKQSLGLVQILPVQETGSDHSPYNTLSSMAYDPTTITTHPKWLPDLKTSDYDAIIAKYDVPNLSRSAVHYDKVKALKRELLEAALKNLRRRDGDRSRVVAFVEFETAEKDWLEPYAFFRALIVWNKTEVVSEWPPAHRMPSLAAAWAESLPQPERRAFRKLTRFYSYVQWIAHEQWRAVRVACDKFGVALIGDIPVGVSIYSADVWSQKEIFDLTRSSGAPPEKVFKSDLFTEKWGQNWGFPLYNWQQMSHDNFAWWRRRLNSACSVFHFLRVDHALGFFRIYCFPWRPEENARFTDLTPEQAMVLTGGRLPGFAEQDDSTEENRERNRIQGDMILRVFLEETGAHRLVAEDLGEVAPYVRPTLATLDIPGFKIPQWERDWDGRLVHGSNYPRTSLATFATHDHPTIRQMWEVWFSQSESAETGSAATHAMNEMMEFCGRSDISCPRSYDSEVHAAFIKGLFATNSWLAVHQITDLFGLRERFNTPGATGFENWTTRIEAPISEWNTTYASPLACLPEALQSSGRWHNSSREG